MKALLVAVAVLCTLGPAAHAQAPAQLTLQEVDALRLALRKCWLPPANGRNIAIDVRLRLLPNGTLAGEPVVLSPLVSPEHRDFAERAKKAVRQCQPFQLPPAKYAFWKDIVIAFDATTMQPSGKNPSADPFSKDPAERAKQMRRLALLVHFGAARWTSAARLLADPAAYRDRVVAVGARFERMVAKDAVFSDGNHLLVVRGASSTFKPGEWWAVSGRLKGTQMLKSASGADVTAPVIDYAASVRCAAAACSDIQ